MRRISSLVFYEGRIEHWLRFGNQQRERILDRRRRVIAFAPGEIFAFVRWEANDYGTVMSRLDIVRACDAREVITTVPGVTPGGELMLRLDSWPRVKDDHQFLLVPWRPIVDRQLGREVSGVLRGGGISWNLGRERGLGI